MKRKVHKDLAAAKARVSETRASYLRALKAYSRHLRRELAKLPVGEEFPLDLVPKLTSTFKKSRRNKKR